MKVMTILGTRPEIIRLSLVIELLDEYCDHTVVHTGQNYDDRLYGLFLRELEVREPDIYLGVKGTGFGDQVGHLLRQIEPLLLEHHPDRILILGDTNSGLSAIAARRLGIPVYHMEAGNRCYDDRVPEEVNRRIIDHCSSVLLPYTNRSRDNLLREGIDANRIYVTGNPIKEVMDHFADRINNSSALTDYGVEPGKFFLVTMHRAENVDKEERLRKLVEALVALYEEYKFPVICSFHPRTRARVKEFGVSVSRPGLGFVKPLGFFDFAWLEKHAFCILSDSGTVQEEACIMRVPNVTIRDVTERPETIECGSNVLSGSDPGTILKLVQIVTSVDYTWEPPPEYLVECVAMTVCRIVLGYRIPDLAEQNWQSVR